MDLPAGRKRVALALSGAIARGFTHIGVIEVLEREHIPVDVIAGTSAGAIAAALYASGMRPPAMREMVERLNWRTMGELVWPREGFISFDKLERWLAALLHGARFEDLAVPCAVVATDLEKGDPYVFTRGPVARAVHASCAVPGLVVPVRFEGRILCDGGVSANIPVAAARQLGADYVIGVDLFPHHIRRGLGPLGMGMAAIESLVRNAGAGREKADYLITPELAGRSYFRMGQYNDCIDLGIKAAEAALGEIFRALELQRVNAEE
jgi:NTE family protein